MIPDKIYIPSANDRLENEWMFEPQKGCDNAVFINKETLVSAIEKQIKFYENSHPVNDFEKGSDAGAVAALKHVLGSL